MQTPLEVIKNAQRGDGAAFNEIVLAYRKRVMVTTARLIGRTEDAEDVAQEVFTRLYFTLRELRDPEAFEVWLHRITVNAAYDYLRLRRNREARMADLSEEQLVLADALAGRQDDWEERRQREIRDFVERLLASVSDADRIILILREIEGLSVSDLGRIYRANPNAIRVRLTRARQRALQAYRAQQASGGAQPATGAPLASTS